LDNEEEAKRKKEPSDELVNSWGGLLSIEALAGAHVSRIGLGTAGTQWNNRARRRSEAEKGGVKRTCWATKRNGERCKGTVVFGTRVCRMHGGTTKKAQVAAGKRQAIAETRALVGRLGTPVEADPRAVLLEMVYSAYGMQLSLAALLQQYDAADLADDDPQVRMRLRSVQNMYGYWSEKAAQFSALAVRAGIEERLVKLAESQAMTVVQVLRGALSAVALPPETERELLQAVAVQLRALMPGGRSPDAGEPTADGLSSSPSAPRTV
jgi:hypothetical protein